jgi:hypothetical protein
MDKHPDWCIQEHCTAYCDVDNQITELDVEDLRTGPWHTARPRIGRSFFLPMTQATSLSKAIHAQLTISTRQYRPH